MPTLPPDRCRRTLPVLRWVGASLAGALACLAVPGAAWADDVLDGAPVVRRTLQFRAGRHEVAGQFGATVGDPFVRNLLPGARYDLHLYDWLSVGADLLIGIPLQTSTSAEIEVKVGKTSDKFVMEASRIAWMATAHASVSPLVGKFIAFGSLPVTFDAHITLSAGVAGIGGSENLPSGVSVAPGVGVGARFFASRVLAVCFDVHNIFLSRALAVDRNSKAALAAGFGTNVLAVAGIGFFMPPDLSRAD